MFNQQHFNDRPEVRPLWQLLLAEQTGLLPALTCAEYRALLDFLTQLVAEGCDPGRVSRRMAHCLIRARGCGQLETPEPALYKDWSNGVALAHLGVNNSWDRRR